MNVCLFLLWAAVQVTIPTMLLSLTLHRIIGVISHHSANKQGSVLSHNVNMVIGIGVSLPLYQSSSQCLPGPPPGPPPLL